MKNCFRPIDLLCEYMENPLGIDTPKPRFSWEVECNERGQYQTAYKIIVSSTEEKLDLDIGDIWDSSKILSNQSVNVVYEGKELKSEQQCHYKVKIWDKQNNESSYSDRCWFEMGILAPDDWKADWIGAPTFGADSSLYRKIFAINKKIIKARVYISGLGYYELYINGKKVGDHVLDPAWTDYRKRVLYATYSVEQLLLQGQNAIGAILGAGWYSKSYLNNAHTTTQLIMMMKIEFEDGSTDLIASGVNDGWMANSNGPIRSSSIYNGEIYDARLEIENWDTAKDLEVKDWLDPLWMEPPEGRMESQMIEPIKVIRELKPISVKSPSKGIFVYDLGQNIAGWARLNVRGARGCQIVMRYAELLYEDGMVNQENLRTAKAVDTYILKGIGTEVFEPHFTYHGFRYIQVEGLLKGMEEDAVTGMIVHSDVKKIGSFHCSSQLLNKIQENIVWTEESNLYGIPTDCPQRDERLGWLNDMTTRAEAALYNFNLVRFYSKWENDIADTQGKVTGAIADTAPFYLLGRRPADPVCSSFLIVPWLIYLHYGDIHILEEHYEGLKKWINYLGIHTNEYIVDYSSYGDWASPVSQTEAGSLGAGALSKKTPGKLISTGYYYYNTKLMVEIAKLLGRQNDVEIYEKLSAKIKKAFNDSFLNKKASQYATGSQACNVFALFLGLVPKENEKSVLENLITDIVKTNNMHLTTGNLCTKYIMEVLSESGRIDIAYALATQETYPSWGYMISQGATTIWERWENVTSSKECGMASHNHPMYGSISSWFYKMLGGINVDIERPGFEKIIIKPYIVDELEYVECSVKTLRGLVRSNWKNTKKELCLDVCVPFNSEAWIYIPKADETLKSIKIFEGETLIWEHGIFTGNKEEIFECIEEKSNIIFIVRSGNYYFKAVKYY